jgi:hypothetical protein
MAPGAKAEAGATGGGEYTESVNPDATVPLGGVMVAS